MKRVYKASYKFKEVEEGEEGKENGEFLGSDCSRNSGR